MKYYLYDLHSQTYTHGFKNRDDLITWLSIWNRLDDNNEYLDLIAMNFQDKYYSDERGDFVLRPYMFIDEDYRIIDVRFWKDEIMGKSKSLSRTSWQYYHDYFIYRKTPVPHTRKRLKYCKYKKSLKKQSLIEKYYYHTYSRPKHINQTTTFWWDFKERNNKYYRSCKTWKKKKIRHQWQKLD